MTVTNNIHDNLANSSRVLDESATRNSHCSHMWSNSERRTVTHTPNKDNKIIRYCYTCRGKIRNYGITPSKVNFSPDNHSTPKVDLLQSNTEVRTNGLLENNIDNIIYLDKSIERNTSITDININNVELAHYIPTISRQIDMSFRRKYTSTQYDFYPTDLSQRRLRKGIKGIGCIVNFSLKDNPKTKRTQIQACSICVMIIAIVVISLILVNYTTLNFMHDPNINSTIMVPTENIDVNETSSAMVSIYTDLTTITETTEIDTEINTTENPFLFTTTKNIIHISNVILKIRKNIKTYPRDGKRSQDNMMPKDTINKQLSQKFCSCQKNEVCMLDEINGVSICKMALDVDDPTGCGGLCAMETEACHLVDKARGVRVCRLLTQVSCSSEDWRCRNGFCVPSSARCDGSIQCYDRSDELHCDCDLTKQFRCGHSISCFPNKKICDGFIDCWDGYDELNCTLECPEDQFTCTNGQCIMSSRFCDGLADCADKSDEPQGCDGACSTHEMRCENNRCVPRSVQCDEKDDCGDSSDELHCS